MRPTGSDILVVDDEADIRDLVSGLLEDEGHAVRVAANSDEALAAIRARKPSLAILDIWMQGGGLDGLELLVRFEPVGSVEPATARVLLNGADVTGQCTTGRNGIHARLHGLLDGDNRLRVEAFVRTPAGLLVEQAREVEVRFRPPLGFDRG